MSAPRRGNLVGFTDAELAAGHRFTQLLYDDHPRIRRAVEEALAGAAREDALRFASKLRGAIALQALEAPPAGRR